MTESPESRFAHLPEPVRLADVIATHDTRSFADRSEDADDQNWLLRHAGG